GLTLAGSPWRLTGTVNVPAATTCTIEPGVVITGQGNTLAVNGTLLAQGTLAQPISFNNMLVSLGAGSSASQITKSAFNGGGPCVCLTARCCAFPAVTITDASPLIQGNQISGVDVGIGVMRSVLAITTPPTLSGNTLPD